MLVMYSGEVDGMTQQHTRLSWIIRVVGPGLVTACVAPCAAMAQADPMHMAYVASANQTGVMEYCQARGWADQQAVDAQKASTAALPPATDTTGISQAEATGKAGSLLNNGVAMPLSSMAAQTHTTEQALCGQFAASAKMAASQRSAMPQMPAMPAMPGGMPALPNGMTMPTMPGMPKPP